MKIGVALSGSGIGGVAAYEVVRQVAALGLETGVYSACGLSALSMLCYMKGPVRAEKRLARLCGELSDRTRAKRALKLARRFAGGLSDVPYPVAVSCVDLSTGLPVIFSNVLPQSRDVIPVSDTKTADILKASLHPLESPCSQMWEGMELCDFTMKYGCPILPVRMAGLRVLSVSFEDRSARTAQDLAARELVERTRTLADYSISIRVNPGRELYYYVREVRSAFSKHKAELYDKLLFSKQHPL